jgi:Protein of unknown function (DUF1153)
MTDLIEAPDTILDMHGEVVTRKDIEAFTNTRWTINRKYIILRAITAGWLTEEECYSRFQMASDELRQWRDAMHKHGPKGLKTTRSAELLEDKRAR